MRPFNWLQAVMTKPGRKSLKLILPPIIFEHVDRFLRDIYHGGNTGLNLLDQKFIDTVLPLDNGYFVELGANDGISQSNTYKLQRFYGWTGLLIEPSPKLFSECLYNRSFGNIPEVRCAACVPFSFKDRFVEIEDSGLMSVAKGLDLTSREAFEFADLGAKWLRDPKLRHCYGALALTLTDILDEVKAPTDFDLLSLDVEGNELSVLKGLDFLRYKPKWILVETRGPEVGEYLQGIGYRLNKTLSETPLYKDLLFML